MDNLFRNYPVLVLRPCRQPKPFKSCSFAVLIFGENLSLRHLVFPEDRLSLLFGSNLNVTRKWLRTHQGALAIPGHIVHVGLNDLTLRIHTRFEVERPDQLRDSEEEVPLRHVDTGT